VADTVAAVVTAVGVDVAKAAGKPRKILNEKAARKGGIFFVISSTLLTQRRLDQKQEAKIIAEA
jgi:hypothetical protein